MTLKGINVLCPCDGNEYSLFTGQGGSEYPLKQYRVEVNGKCIAHLFNTKARKQNFRAFLNIVQFLLKLQCQTN
jgi:hypothetical protein